MDDGTKDGIISDLRARVISLLDEVSELKSAAKTPQEQAVPKTEKLPEAPKAKLSTPQPKKPMTEAQKAALARCHAANRAKAASNRSASNRATKSVPESSEDDAAFARKEKERYIRKCLREGKHAYIWSDKIKNWFAVVDILKTKGVEFLVRAKEGGRTPDGQEYVGVDGKPPLKMRTVVRDRRYKLVRPLAN